MTSAKRSYWKTKELPASKSTVPLDRLFSSDEMSRIQAGLVPEVMEDKWFIYWENEKLYFHRSWTGYCIYIVRFEADLDGYRMVEADVNRNPEQYSRSSDSYDTEMINYLIDTLLLRQPAIFPKGDDSSKVNVILQWSMIGRAMLGQHPTTIEDAKQSDDPEPPMTPNVKD